METIEETTTDRIRTIDNYGFFALMLLLIIGMLIVGIPRRKEKTEEHVVVQQADPGS